MDPIVVCGILRNAASHILEWLAFHRLVGVDRFVLYDLGSSDGTAALVARSRFDRYVTVIDWSQGGGRAEAYADFAARHTGGFAWAAILDPGDFLHPVEADTIRALLPRYDSFSAVMLRRLHFVTAARPARTGQFVIAHCTDRLPADSARNAPALALLRVRDLQGVAGTPPSFAMAGMACNAHGEPISPPARLEQTSADVLVVHRYDSGVTAAETEQDRHILRFIPRLRALLHVPVAEAPRTAAPVPAAPAPPRPPLLLGIGIISYNRRETLAATLDHVRRHTKHPRTILAVADDGSTDGTAEMLRAQQILTVTGRNMGIAWNKNRALFLLSALLRCDVTILLEDDAYPSEDNWENEWLKAATRWGHVNNTVHWLSEHFLSGAGTADDPILSRRLTAQCSVFSREAVLFGGYYDTRFHLYGHEHVEHTYRLLRMGYGGVIEEPANQKFKLIHGGLSYHEVASTIDAKEEVSEHNRVLAHTLAFDFSYRAPWQNEDEARQMRDEMRHTVPRAVL